MQKASQRDASRLSRVPDGKPQTSEEFLARVTVTRVTSSFALVKISRKNMQQLGTRLESVTETQIWCQFLLMKV